MFNWSDISIHLSFDWYYLLIFGILFFLYTFYTYKYTLPVVPGIKKWFLIFLRSLILILLLILIFEPTVKLKKKVVIEPVNLVFVDNSQSIAYKDSLNRANLIRNFLRKLANSNGQPVFFTFGQKITPLNPDSLNKPDFTETGTNFNLIFNKLNNFNKPVASVTIISDGQINEGENPLSKFEKLNIPFFTVGIGDTTTQKDLSISKVLYNDYIYKNKPTTVKVMVLNKNSGKRTVYVSFKENSQLIATKQITFNQNGIKSVDFEYKPDKAGIRKLTFSVSKITGEDNFENNKKVEFVKVLESKIKVLLVSGSPSPDVSFVRNALEQNKDMEVSTIIQIAPNKFLNGENSDELIDSCDVIFLTGFPGKYTPPNLTGKIFRAIDKKNKPYFIMLSGGTDFIKLKNLEKVLNFKLRNTSDKYSPVQISLVDENSPLFKRTGADYRKIWESLPPVDYNLSGFSVKPNGKILADVKINNIPTNKPLIISQVAGNKKSISFLGKNIWRWKLQTADLNSTVFDKFIINVVKWLYTDTKVKLFKIKTNKKIYAPGETVFFSAQAYDETLSPLDDAHVTVHIKMDGKDTQLPLNSAGNGVYEGEFTPNKSGDYSFKAIASVNDKTVGTATGIFNVGELNIELINIKLNSDYLKLIANSTGGKYFYLTGQLGINGLLEKIRENNLIYTTEINEIKIWSNYWILISLILLFAVEWLIRKIAGML